jgi:prophage antirepressor-like protein
MEQINLFNDEFKNIRMELVDGEPWYVFEDICREFDSDYPNGEYGDYYRDLLDDQKGFLIIDQLDKKTKILTVNSKAISSLLVLLGLDNDEFKKFSNWIYHQVVPAINETGNYTDTENLIDNFNLYQKN